MVQAKPGASTQQIGKPTGGRCTGQSEGTEMAVFRMKQGSPGFSIAEIEAKGVGRKHVANPFCLFSSRLFARWHRDASSGRRQEYGTSTVLVPYLNGEKGVCRSWYGTSTVLVPYLMGENRKRRRVGTVPVRYQCCTA